MVMTKIPKQTLINLHASRILINMLMGPELSPWSEMSKPGPGVWPECLNTVKPPISNHQICEDLGATNTGGGVLGESNHRGSLLRGGVNTSDSSLWRRIHSFPDSHVQLWDVLYIYFFFYHNSYMVILMSNAMFLWKLIPCFGLL